MARVRLLTKVILAVPLLLVFTCGTWLHVWGPGFYTCGPIWGRRVEGKIVDKRTGEPIEGAGVFAFYTIPQLHSFPVDWRWTTSDAEGRFAIPGHMAFVWLGRFGFLARTDRFPTFQIVHPQYGESLEAFGDEGHFWPGWRSLRFEMEPDAYELEQIREPHRLHNWEEFCLDWMPAHITDECCRILWGSPDVCTRAGRSRN